ncbi:MAG: hypothetical protein K2I90_10230, partial [Odoribacter sp.]|nr:hypothetical protein [Odoribacter sp.]
AYTGTTDRNVVLTIKAGSLTKTMTVTQKAVQALTLTKDKFDVPQEGGDITVEVKSNIDYTVSIPDAYKEWITETPQSKAMETKSFRFTIAANEEAEKREGHIVISGNELKDTVYVYQTEGRRLILDKDSCTLSAWEQELTVELRTNVDYEIVIPDTVSDWVSYQPESRALRTDKLQLLIGENEQPEERRAVVIVKDKNSELADTLHIRQQVKEEESDQGFSGTSYTLEYQANSTNTIWFTVSVSWKATISYEGEENGWLSLSATSGAKGNPYITISSTSKNEAITPRKAYIDITYGSKTQRLTVTQLANGEIDITDKFDPEFAKVLQEKGYVQDATHITVGEVNKTTYLYLHDSQLTSLQGIEYFTALTIFTCSSNQLTTLDVSKNTRLIDLSCNNNQLTTLDVSKNTALEILYCDNNQLATLDVSKNTALTTLGCNNNQLTTGVVCTTTRERELSS